MLENFDTFSWHNMFNSNFYFLNEFYGNMFGKSSSFISKNGQLNLLLYEYILYEQPYINLNMIDLINPKKHLDVSVYTKFLNTESLNLKNTHYDLIFPYFYGYVWEILPYHVFWFFDEFSYSLPKNFYDSIFFENILDKFIVRLKNHFF